MPYQLVVTRPFEGREIGSRVTDQVEIDRIMAPGHNHNVVRVWVEPEPKSDPVKAEVPAKGAAKPDTHA